MFSVVNIFNSSTAAVLYNETCLSVIEIYVFGGDSELHIWNMSFAIVFTCTLC